MAFIEDMNFKSFKLISKYTQKCQCNSLYQKEKPLCNTLNWGNWNSGFVKLSDQWAERDKSSLFLMKNPVLSGSKGVVETTRNTIPLENPGGE